MNRLTVAVCGINGAGKSTAIASAVEELTRKGIKVGVINIPQFRGIRILSIISRPAIKMWDLTKWKRGKLFIFPSGLIVTLIYYLARLVMIRKEIVFIEGDPRIDVEPYSYLYMGSLGSFVARTLRFLWPRPDVVILVPTEPYLASKRVSERREKIRFHQSGDNLALLGALVKKSAKSVAGYDLIETVQGNLLICREPNPKLLDLLLQTWPYKL